MELNSCVPWQDERSWAEMRQSLLPAIKNIESRSGRLESLAEQIAMDNMVIDAFFKIICQKSCGVCWDVCCSRATVWYDFQDVLFYYYHWKEFPSRQIKRQPSGDCVHLCVDGCGLERIRRPFICNWYICPDQKKMFKENYSSEWEVLQVRIGCIKAARKQMEQLFIKLLS